VNAKKSARYFLVLMSWLVLFFEPANAQTQPINFKWLAKSTPVVTSNTSAAPAPCDQKPIDANTAIESFRPCVSDLQRAVPFADRQYLVYALNTKAYPPFMLELTVGAQPGVVLKPYLGAALDLPIKVKLAVFNNAHDIRAWPIYERDYNNYSQQKDFRGRFGVPTEMGLVTSRSIFDKYLSPPGNAISTAQDSALAKLFDNRSNEYVLLGARIGPTSVVIKDTRQTATRLARFDAKTKVLEQNLKIKGFEEAPACDPEDTQQEFVFNDDQNQLYLLRGRSGNVYAISEQLQARLVARLPELVGAQKDQCGETRSRGRVFSAIKMPSGNLLMSVGGSLMLQQGQSFFAVAAPSGVVQIIPVNGNDVVVIAQEGLAQFTLPSNLK
jgi:hypothetical protein